MSSESAKLILAAMVLLTTIAVGIYLQKIDAPVYGIPALLEKLFSE